jgi:hypothetical protein
MAALEHRPLGQIQRSLIFIVLWPCSGAPGSFLAPALRNLESPSLSASLFVAAAVSLAGVAWVSTLLARPYRSIVVPNQPMSDGWRQPTLFAYAPMIFALLFAAIAIKQHFDAM